MMIPKQKLLVFVLVLAVGFGSLYSAAAQTAETTPATTTDSTDLQDEIAAVDEAAQIDNTALLTKLSAQFQVDLAVLQDLNAQGYTTGQIWLALEISLQSGKPLADAVAQAASMNTSGHGWGVLAQALGIDPGSQEFFALKEKLQIRTRTMASEVAAEHGNRVMTQQQTQERTQTKAQVRTESSGKPENAGASQGNAHGASSGKSGANGVGDAGGGAGSGAAGHGSANGAGSIGNGPKR
ncbi:MAG TPA: hypothetical protein DHU26_08450 [Spirochaetaceae bacterium]|jgi:hypothetical protein|uniref:hypothetical protein n=1 Tax=Rectinema subterraneum TaxID=2653714 RepID=UPI000EDEB7B0|nr:hypothetical protein [Rectinema subterraneum]HCX96980.1 hypothetical protein [Spirochaetaceae bacterium]